MGKKRAVNVSLDAELVTRAKALDINLSQALESGLRELVRELEARAWQEDHREAIERFNSRIDERGLAGDEHRRYG